MNKPHVTLLLLAVLLLSACGGEQPTRTPDPPASPREVIGPVWPTEASPGQHVDLPIAQPSPTATYAPAFAEYKVRAGDTLGAISVRYNMNMQDIMSFNGMTNPDALQIGQVLRIPVTVTLIGPADKIIPDSELVYGPAYASFDTIAFATKSAGYLVDYSERVEGTVMTGPQIVQLVAERFSVGPRVLLTILEMEGGWVTSKNLTQTQVNYPMGHADGVRFGLYKQAFWMASQLNAGYYGLHDGNQPLVQFSDRRRARFAQGINPGTAAVQNALAVDSTYDEWKDRVGPNGFAATYRKLFGDPSANSHDPVIPADLKQPALRLPFPDGHMWYFTGGPHAGWVDGSAWAALDFTPKDQAGSCWTSADWAIAAAPGKIVQAEKGRVVENLSGTDFAGNGWSLLYMHMAAQDRVAVGTVVKTGDQIGHPSCEGGAAETSHLHFARLYNGQWIFAGSDRFPMVLSGWVTQGASQEYDGRLVRGSDVREADNAQIPEKNSVIPDGDAK